jgi:hypothetical protein
MTAGPVVLDDDALVFRKDAYFERTAYNPHSGQKLFHYDNTRHRIMSNGRRWGKTLAGGKEAETMAFVKNFLGEPMQGWIIGPEYTDCEKEFRVVYNTFKKLGIDQVSNKFLNNVESGSMRIKTKWGFDLQCRSAKHPDSLVGEGLDFVLIVEAGRHHRRMFTEYVRPALSDKRGWSIMSGVPEIASDTALLYWAFERGQDSTKTQWRSFRMPSWTNDIVFPGGRNDPEILEAEDDLTEDEFRRQYGGEFVERIGRVMKEWDDETHLVSGLNYNPALPLYAAVDYGYANDWVWLWIQVDMWGYVYVIGEHRWRMMDTGEIAADMLSMKNTGADLWTLLDKVVCIYAPPAEPDQTSTLQRKLAIPTRTNTGGMVNDRDRLTNKMLKLRPSNLPGARAGERLPGMTFNRERTTQLAWEMRQGYRWPEHKSETKNANENPMDKDNHGPEALGRFTWGHFGNKEKTRTSRQSRVRARRR